MGASHVRGMTQVSGSGFGCFEGSGHVVTVHVERTPRRFWPRSALVAIAGRGLGSVPPPMLVVAGIVSLQLGAALAKLLFPIAGALGVVTLRLVLSGAVMLVAWRPSLRMTRRAWLVIVAFGTVLGSMNAMFYE